MAAEINDKRIYNAKNQLSSTFNTIFDFPEEIHLPLAKFHNGEPQPEFNEIKEGFRGMYDELLPRKNSTFSPAIAHKYWTVEFTAMMHCGIKKYGDVNNLDKKRLNLHERIIHAITVIPPGSTIKQYPLGGIFTFNPFYDVVCGYVFTSWRDVSDLVQSGISHVAVFRKISENYNTRTINNVRYLTKNNVTTPIDMVINKEVRKMRMYVCNSGTDSVPKYGIILQDVATSQSYILDLVKLRVTPEKKEPQTESIFPSFSDLLSYIPNLNYLDEIFEDKSSEAKDKTKNDIQ